jgi:hypothetical protein
MKKIKVKVSPDIDIKVGDMVCFEIDGTLVFDIIENIGQHTVEGRHYDLSYINFQKAQANGKRN